MRGQLWDVRVSTGADLPNGTWNRGVLQFFYDQAQSFGGSNPDNNGNVTAAKHYRPLDESAATWAISTDTYSYDALNRITSVSEKFVSSTQAETPQFVQGYLYDRYGNRTINQTSTSGIGINKKEFTVNPVNNRLGVPGGQIGTMTYDNAGNLTSDTYSGAGVTREYDAENRMTKETQAGTYVAGSYTYDGDGRRVRRTVYGVETWQVYGMGGELLAEYPVNGPTGSPQKEYGYRNGQLLVRAEPAAIIKWLVADQLGTPRIIIDKTGARANVKRHDYLPFGEELLVGQGSRTADIGYSGDTIRQKFTSKERDNETGLDYFLARYYSSTQGRFTSPDEFKGGPQALWVLGSGDPEKQALVYADITNPQSLNKYQYVFNNPLRYVDPDGQEPQDGYDIRFQKNIEDFNAGRIDEKEYWARMRGGAVGVASGVGVVIAGRVIMAAPGAVPSILSWMLRNQNTVQQVAQDAVQMSTGSPASASRLSPNQIEQIGTSIAREVIKTGERQMSGIAARVTARGLAQADAVGTVQTAILNIGKNSYAVPQANGTVVLAGVRRGANQAILIVNKQGVVSHGTATINAGTRRGKAFFEVTDVVSR